MEITNIRETEDTYNTFTCFGNLPVELQVMIFTEALPQEPKVMKLIIYAKYASIHGMDCVRFGTDSTPHFFLSFTRASREAMLQVYSTIPQPELGRVTRFNADIDTILLVGSPIICKPDTLSAVFGQYDIYPFLPGTLIPDKNFGTRNVNQNTAAMLSGIKTLAINLLRACHYLHEWEDQIPKNYS